MLRKGLIILLQGGALVVDLDVAEAIVFNKNNLMRYYDNVKLEMAIPCLNQDLKWKKEDKKRYRDILSKADFVTYVGKKYTFDCMRNRNEYLVNQVDKVIAIWNGEIYGGTWNTILYCKNIGKDIEIIDLRKI